MKAERETTALALVTDASVTAPPGSGIPPGSPEFERTATHMAREFTGAMAEIARLIDGLRIQVDRLDTAYSRDEGPSEYRYSRFGMEIYSSGRRYDLDDKGITDLAKEMERRAWDVLVDKLGVKNVMSVAKRKIFDDQLRAGELPPVCEETITAILLGLAGQAQEFARDAAREVFDMLRPRNHHAGGKYSTNNAFRVGRRVILPYRVEAKWGGGGWRVTYGREQEMTALDGVFHLLDGRGVMRENRGPLVNAIDKSDAGGRGETEYFRFRCYKNRNLHLEFKRLDLVKQLNGLAAGEYVLGEDGETST